MSDQVKIVSIGTLGVVTVLSFLLLPADATIHSDLVLGLLALIGVHVVAAGIKWIGARLGLVINLGLSDKPKE